MNKGFVRLENFQNSRRLFKCACIANPTDTAQKVPMRRRLFRCKLGSYEAPKTKIETLKAEVTNEHDRAHQMERSFGH